MLSRQKTLMEHQAKSDNKKYTLLSVSKNPEELRNKSVKYKIRNNTAKNIENTGNVFKKEDKGYITGTFFGKPNFDRGFSTKQVNPKKLVEQKQKFLQL
jgi:hypothetical protein